VSSLEQAQRAMMLAIDEGPVHLPPGLFAGPASRIIAGMKVHANTISHARLVALEESFPRVLALLGHAEFNRHSRGFLLRAEAVRVALAVIGREFPRYLSCIPEAAFASALAQFDWLWLEAFRAPEVRSLVLADLAGIRPQELPQIVLQRHPATRLAPLDDHIRGAVGNALSDMSDAEWLLLVRPEDQVRILPVTAAMRSILVKADFPASIGNLLAVTDEPGSSPDCLPDAPMQALIALIEAGALREVRE